MSSGNFILRAFYTKFTKVSLYEFIYHLIFTGNQPFRIFVIKKVQNFHADTIEKNQLAWR